MILYKVNWKRRLEDLKKTGIALTLPQVCGNSKLLGVGLFGVAFFPYVGGGVLGFFVVF